MNLKYDIIYVGDNRSFISSIFLQALIKNLKKNKKFKIKYIVNTYNDHNYGLLKTIKKKIKIFFSSLLKSQYNDFLHKIKSLNFPNMSQIAEKHNIKFMNFSKLNKTSKKKNCLLINCVGGEIYKKELLKLFSICINYHHAELPKYRGLNSNGYSLMKNKNYTFYTFHYIHPKIDRGYVIFKGKIKKRKNYHYNSYYDLFKINDASKKIELILQKALSNKSKRKMASVGGKYYSAKYFKNIFNNLIDFRLEEINNFIKIFGGFYYNSLFITEIKKSNSGKQLKNCKIKFSKISNLPIGIYFFFKKINLFNLFKLSKR